MFLAQNWPALKQCLGDTMFNHQPALFSERRKTIAIAVADSEVWEKKVTGRQCAACDKQWTGVTGQRIPA